MLLDAGDTPRSPEIDDRNRASGEVRAGEADDGPPRRVGQSLQRRQLHGGCHLADQGGGKRGGIAAAQGKGEYTDEDDKDRQWKGQRPRSPAIRTGRRSMLHAPPRGAAVPLLGFERGESAHPRLVLPSETMVKISILRSAIRSPTTGRKSLKCWLS